MVSISISSLLYAFSVLALLLARSFTHSPALCAVSLCVCGRRFNFTLLPNWMHLYSMFSCILTSDAEQTIKHNTICQICIWMTFNECEQASKQCVSMDIYVWIVWWPCATIDKTWTHIMCIYNKFAFFFHSTKFTASNAIALCNTLKRMDTVGPGRNAIYINLWYMSVDRKQNESDIE